eukprot:CAMPEP_0178919372 /NCGR_PEP_ID=MMETSP0786-20121207/14398_1 /TAXON_ID=186022 /ORGANISM="Thalassionema frauenfeldii, Strain CCMP 1798" /LENGTH=181 /DNA_ID=CAMNT_0020593291 /DNA_START=49 /DNA_END=591 /DNA_ORIENTATION=+
MSGRSNTPGDEEFPSKSLSLPPRKPSQAKKTVSFGRESTSDKWVEHAQNAASETGRLSSSSIKSNFRRGSWLDILPPRHALMKSARNVFDDTWSNADEEATGSDDVEDYDASCENLARLESIMSHEDCDSEQPSRPPSKSKFDGMCSIHQPPRVPLQERRQSTIRNSFTLTEKPIPEEKPW